MMIDFIKLTRVMSSRHVTQKEMAKDLGFSKSWFHRVKHNADVTFSRACEVADYLHVPVDYLRADDSSAFSAYSSRRDLEKLLFRTRFVVELGLIKKLVYKYDLPISKITDEMPEFKDVRELGEELWGKN